MKTDFTLDDCTILTQALRLKRDSILRARNKTITGSELFNVYNRELEELNKVDLKVAAIVDSVWSK